MYEALDTRTKLLYSGNTIADLRENIELNIVLENVPPQYHSSWSNSRCITYLIQADYITPYSGPEWFMALKPDGATGESPNEAIIDFYRTRMELIQPNGTINMNARARITTWRERNHVRLVIHDNDMVYSEIVITEESLRNLWTLIGKQIGFDHSALYESVRNLPPPQLYTPEVPPERFQQPDSDGFNILRAIGELDIGLDESEDEPDDDNED